jgi:hypothetical protein
MPKSKESLIEHKQKVFKRKFSDFFSTSNKLYHFILTSKISDLDIFRAFYQNFLQKIRRKKIVWKRTRVIETQVQGFWHLHIAGTYLPKSLDKLWSYGHVKVVEYSPDYFDKLASYLSKDFSMTNSLLPKGSRLLYHFDELNNKTKKGSSMNIFDSWREDYHKEYYQRKKEQRKLEFQKYYQLNKESIKAKRREKYLASKVVV